MLCGIGNRDETLGRLILSDKVEGRLQQINRGRCIDKERPLFGVIEAIQADGRLFQDDMRVNRAADLDMKIVCGDDREGGELNFGGNRQFVRLHAAPPCERLDIPRVLRPHIWRVIVAREPSRGSRSSVTRCSVGDRARAAITAARAGAPPLYIRMCRSIPWRRYGSLAGAANRAGAGGERSLPFARIWVFPSTSTLLGRLSHHVAQRCPLPAVLTIAASIHCCGGAIP